MNEQGRELFETLVAALTFLLAFRFAMAVRSGEQRRIERELFKILVAAFLMLFIKTALGL